MDRMEGIYCKDNVRFKRGHRTASPIDTQHDQEWG